MDDLVLNYHVTEKCNYSCKYCFSKYGLENRFNDELHHDLNAVETLLRKIYNYFQAKYKITKIRLNLAGGEPLLLSSIGRIVDVAKDIGYELSLITNSSPLTIRFIEENAVKFSVVGISIDSFFNETNIDIGRSTISRKTTNSVDIQKKIQLLIDLNPDISIKINTVVSRYNCDESMEEEIIKLNPSKWKIFKELSRGGCSIDDELFQGFVKKNTGSIAFPVFVENNDDMTDSYLMIDPLGRFYQNSNENNLYVYSDHIIQVGVEYAVKQVFFDRNKFKSRYIPMQKKYNKALCTDGNFSALDC